MPSRKPDSTIISVNAGSIQVPGPFSAGFSAYNSSKFAVLKMFEILAAETPDVHVMSMHPGVGTCRIWSLHNRFRLLLTLIT